MTRKSCNRRVIAPLPPRGLRPKLTPAQVRDLGIVNLVNLDAIAKGSADEATLWHVVGGCLTFFFISGVLQLGVEEMEQQIEMVNRMVHRYGKTGRFTFTGPEYQLAKEGVQVMEALAEAVDLTTALAAAAWSDARIRALAPKAVTC